VRDLIADSVFDPAHGIEGLKAQNNPSGAAGKCWPGQGARSAGLGAVARAIAGVSELAVELGKHTDAPDADPRIFRPDGAVAAGRWQFRPERSLLSADRARREQRMNPRGLVHHLRDSQVQHRAGQRQRRCLADSVAGLQPGQHRVERIAYRRVEIRAEAKGDLTSRSLGVHSWYRTVTRSS
jgi:hypothetical protein